MKPKFKAITTEGKWVEGFLLPNNVIRVGRINKDADGNEYTEVVGDFKAIPETVCMSTGLKDSNGKEIFEGDKFFDDEDSEYFAIEWNYELCCFQCCFYGYNIYFGEGSLEIESNKLTVLERLGFDCIEISMYEITGNIHDNLLKK